ncbi:Laminin subunit alpha-2 [Bienertia sinuspersici]
MFKVGRWRHEKIKVVFKLQFQVSQVPCSKSKLMLSVVPVDVGQPTVRLGKAAVQDGICTWENPVYEKVKLTIETKTGKVQDKIYQFIISTGSSKAGFLGEVLVNLADYVDATAPYTISLPIKSSNAGAILHVSIQNMQGADYQREPQMEIEENRTSITHEGSLQSQDSNFRSEGDVNCYSHEDEYNTMSPLNNEGKKNIKNGNTLNSFFEQKQSRSHQETNSDQSPNQNKPVPKPIIPSDKERPARKPLVLDWSSDEDYITNYAEETNNIREQEQEPPKSLVEQLEREIFALKRQAEVTDIELQSLRRQVVKETKRAQDFSEQVVRLKEERNAFRRESDKTMLKQDGENGNERPKETGTESKKSRHRKNEVEEDLVHAKDFNKALRSQLRKTQDSNSELILVVRDLEEKLGKKEKELDDLTRKLKSEKKSDELQDMNTEHELFSDTELEDEQSPKENPTEVILLQQQIKSLQGEVEVHLKENRKLQERIKQFSQDSELGKKENDDLSSKFNQKQLELIKKERECAQNARKVEELESQIARLEKVIKQQAEEFGDSSDTIRDLETQVNSLKYELEKQAAEYEDEFKVMTNAKVELEQKALQAEESLRKTKLDNASAAQRLQDEFRELSDELEAKFKENEELTEKAETEARELRLYINTLEEQLGKVTKELESVQDRCTTEVEKLSTQLEVKENQQKQLLLAHKDELMELKSNKKRVEDKCQALSTENQALRMEVERLTEENYYFTKKEEEMERLVDETNKSVQETKRDKEELETKFSLATIEIKQAQEELKSLRPMKEKEDSMAAVQSELEKLQVQHHELNNRLSEIKLENENLRKQLIKHKENLHKKDHEIANLEKIKDSSSKEVSTLKEKVKQLKAVRPSGISPDNGCKDERKNMVKKSQLSATSSKSLQNGGSRAPGESRKEFTEKKVTNSQTNDLLSEVALLKEKNKTMGDELKEMQEKYSEVSLKFAEVEGERQQLVMTIRNLRNGQKK